MDTDALVYSNGESRGYDTTTHKRICIYLPNIVSITIASLNLLLEAELLEEEATREAVELLVSAALIEKMAIDQAMASLTAG